MTDLAVVAIVKNEQRYLPEWLAFHEIVGVEHFYIFENGSSDSTAEILSKRENVTLIDWPGPARQLEAYAYALANLRARWLAFIDADEYLFSPTYLPLPKVLGSFASDPAVGVCWATFGTSWQAHPVDDTLRTYKLRANDVSSRVNYHVKSIVQPSRVRSMRALDPHHFDCDGVDELGRPLDGPFAHTPSRKLLRINHYVSRSAQEAREKMACPRADTNTPRDMDLQSPLFNDTYDTVILPYAPSLDARLGR